MATKLSEAVEHFQSIISVFFGALLVSSGDCLGTNWEKKCSGNQIGQKLFYDDKIRQNNAMAIKLGRIALATKLGKTMLWQPN